MKKEVVKVDTSRCEFYELHKGYVLDCYTYVDELSLKCSAAVFVDDFPIGDLSSELAEKIERREIRNLSVIVAQDYLKDGDPLVVELKYDAGSCEQPPMKPNEVYDKAIQNGLEFTYFHGEDECPEEWKGEHQETFWEMELESANRNLDKQWALEFYKRDVENDQKESDENRKRIPPFISECTNVSDARKAVAYDCYAELRYGSNGFGYVSKPGSSNDDGIDYMHKPFNWNRGFDSFFNG